MATATTPLELVDTTRLVEGDIVWTHGLRVLLGPVTSTDSHPFGPIYASVGEVLNPEFIAEHPSIFGGIVSVGDTYTIQGNNLARWSREVQS